MAKGRLFLRQSNASEFPTRGGFAPIQVGLIERLLSDTAENAAPFSILIKLLKNTGNI
jgi:hypothetical protein